MTELPTSASSSRATRHLRKHPQDVLLDASNVGLDLLQRAGRGVSAEVDSVADEADLAALRVALAGVDPCVVDLGLATWRAGGRVLEVSAAGAELTGTGGLECDLPRDMARACEEKNRLLVLWKYLDTKADAHDHMTFPWRDAIEAGVRAIRRASGLGDPWSGMARSVASPGQAKDRRLSFAVAPIDCAAHIFGGPVGEGLGHYPDDIGAGLPPRVDHAKRKRVIPRRSMPTEVPVAAELQAEVRERLASDALEVLEPLPVRSGVGVSLHFAVSPCLPSRR
jgi:hypothetical protein